MVRAATEVDIAMVCRMAERFHHEIKPLPVEYVDSAHIWEVCLDLGVLGVAVDNGAAAAAGFVAALPLPYLGNESVKIMAEVAWWVEPEYRRGRAGLDLMTFLENEAVSAGASFLSMFSFAGEHDVSKIYLKRGFEEREKTFMKRI